MRALLTDLFLIDEILGVRQNVFTILFALALAQVKGKPKETMLNFFEGLSEVMFKFTGLVMLCAPFGIGAAMGPATVGTVGYEGRTDYTAIGSVINLASRLCAEAAPGQIVVSQRAFAAVEDFAEARPIAPLTLKGFGHPIPAVEILRWRETDSADADTNNGRSVAAARGA